MIAPLPQPPVKPRRRTPLSAARQAVVEALLDAEEYGGRRRMTLRSWRTWLVIGAVAAAAILYCLL